MVSIDEIASGLLVNAISAAGRWLGTAAGAARSVRGQAAEDLVVARWFETYELTQRISPGAPRLSDAATERLADLLRGDDAQAAVQELLAVRLTDGPNADAVRAREAFVLALASARDPEVSAYATALADFYDDEISDLVGRLSDSPLLAQVRSEALSARMIAVLHAIERHTAALSARPAPRVEADFLVRYRTHIRDQHGKIEPPDFERRRRVPIADIYVPTAIYKEEYPEPLRLAPDVQPASITVFDLAGRLDRTVLLGDPGGGKTTASTILMHYFASDTARRIPFLVTLRNFASEDPPARSVVGFIELELETLYQCPAPPGLVDLLLLTGRAVVIFDGLDELLDTARRAEVSTRVERFCTEYPLAPVMVTSRVVGYDQARLDESQFNCFRLGGFQDEDVADYAHKWFALDEGAHPDDSDVFLSESESVPDLRANPLVLSLMCILYRGEGSLPRNRAEVYEQCANLLFRRWDARRRIHQELRAGHLLEPALRHWAWWLFTRSDTQTAVTERELVAATTEFLRDHGFESLDDAREAAREFVEFSRSRMWVFSDQGTTATGEKLYAFTHRTFMEYFAAAQIAYDSDTAEKLARTLAPRIARGKWEVVGEISIQIKNSTSRNGAKRVFEFLLDERRRRSAGGRRNILAFLSRALRSVDPSPPVVRRLTREILDFLLSKRPDNMEYRLPLAQLLANCEISRDIVANQIASSIKETIDSGKEDTLVNALWLTLSLYIPWGTLGGYARISPGMDEFWAARARDLMELYSDLIVAAAESHPGMRVIAMTYDMLSIEDVLSMKDGLLSLLQAQPLSIYASRHAHLLIAFYYLAMSNSSDGANEFALVGRTIIARKQISSIREPVDFYCGFHDSDRKATDSAPPTLSVDAYLGAATVLLMCIERADSIEVADFMFAASKRQDQFGDLYKYIQQRHRRVSEPTMSLQALPDLPVPEEFKQVFRDWAKGKVDFVEPAPDSSD